MLKMKPVIGIFPAYADFPLLRPIEKVVTRTAEIFSDENDIIHIIILEGARIDYYDALDNSLVIRSLSENKKILKLIDARCKWSIDKKAKQFIAKKEIAEKTIARAILVNTLVKKILLSFYLVLNKSKVPVKTFTDYNAAYNWLLIKGIKEGKYQP